MWRKAARERLLRVMEHPATDVTVVALILLSVVLIVAEVVLPPRDPWYLPVEAAGDVITLLFALELTLRFLAAPRKREFLRRWWVDILSVLPLLRFFRIFRVLRLLRVFRAGMVVNRRLSLFTGSFRRGAGEALFVFLVLIMVVLTGAVGIHMLEAPEGAQEFDTFDESFWWSFLSFLSGEPAGALPHSTAGKVLAVLVAIGGMTIFALLTGVFAAALVHRLRETMSVRKDEIARLRDHVVICGWDRTGDRIVAQLTDGGRRRDVVIVTEADEPPTLGPAVRDRSRVWFVQGDYTRLDVLRDTGLERAAIAILLADKTKPRSDQDRDARTVLAAMLVEKLNPRVFTCVELLNPDNESHLRQLGVEEIVVVDDYGASIIASASENQGMVAVFNELLRDVGGNRFCKIDPDPEEVGQSVAALAPRLKQRANALLVAVERPNPQGRGRHSIVNPPLDLVLQPGDRLVLITDRTLG